MLAPVALAQCFAKDNPRSNQPRRNARTRRMLKKNLVVGVPSGEIEK